MSLSQFIKRARASTKAILGRDYQEEVNDNAELPKPPKDISMYTEARLKEGLAFADHTLRNKKRKVSPITNHCLTLYKSTVKAALEMEYHDEEEQNSLLATILMCEQDICMKRFLRAPPDKEDVDLIQRLAELRRYEFAARYGDYMANVCQELKSTAQTERTQYFEQLQGWQRYWTDIYADIKGEHTAWKQWWFSALSIQDEQIKTTLAIFNVCNHMGLNFDRVLETIKMFAESNTLVHTSILCYVESGLWHRLAEILASDMRDLPAVIPSNLRENIPIMQEIIQAVIDEYFITDEALPMNVNRWIPKEVSYDKAAKMQVERKRRQDTAIEERKKIEQQAAKRCKELIGKHSLVHLTAAVYQTDAPSGDVSTPPAKRPLSDTEKAERMETYKRQKKAWNQLVQTQREAHKRLIDYGVDFGSLESPIDPQLWLDLGNADESTRPTSSGVTGKLVAGPEKKSEIEEPEA